MYEDNDLALNLTDTDNYRLFAHGTIENKISDEDSNKETVDENIGNIQ